MTFYNKVGKEKATRVGDVNTDVFMVMPYDDELYLKFYTDDNGSRTMRICATKSHLDVTYPITGKTELYPNMENIALVKQLLDSRKKVF